MNHDELARLLPVPDGRDLPADRKQILKEHLMTELRQADGNKPNRHKSWARRPGRIAASVGLTTAAITATAVAVAVAMATAGPNPSAPLGVPNPTTLAPNGSTPQTAAQLLA